MAKARSGLFAQRPTSHLNPALNGPSSPTLVLVAHVSSMTPSFEQHDNHASTTYFFAMSDSRVAFL